MTMTTRNDDIIEQLRLQAVNDVTRAVARDGITLTHDEADDLGEQVLDWMRRRLGMAMATDAIGVTFAPATSEVRS